MSDSLNTVRKEEKETMKFRDEEENQGNKYDGWTKYYDKQYKAYYWYNSITGESVWDDQSTEENGENVRRPELESQGLLTGRGKEDADQDEINEFKSSTDVFCFSAFLYCNAVFLEQPFCFTECLIRIALLGCYGLAYLVYYLLLKRSWRGGYVGLKRITRDVVLTSCVALSLLIPGFLLYSYREYRPENDWNLAPLPTILGKVDMRRFAVLTVFGSGTLAKNIDSTSPSFLSEDVWEDSIIFFPRDTIMCISRVTRERINSSPT